MKQDSLKSNKGKSSQPQPSQRKPSKNKLSDIKPSSNVKSPRTIGQMMIWSCVGMAYFNFFSSLNLSPGLQFGLSGVLPMAALIGYLLFRKPVKSPANPAADAKPD